MNQTTERRPRLLTATNLVRRGNRYTAIRVPLISGAEDVVKLPREYRSLYEQYLIPHLVRAGCVSLAGVEWDWTGNESRVATGYPSHIPVADHPFGIDLARQLMAVNGLLEPGGDYSYGLLPVPAHEARWFQRIRLITQDLRPRLGKRPPVGVMVTELIAYPTGERVNWAGVVLAGSKDQQRVLRQTWMSNLGMVGNPEPPYLGPGY